ncbi:hypothetical protein [Streptobacillus moniliformis]|uniref:hypothetical protein n=1 Tax=Streptobacillus moniliformis TaxID=34105 RepID=UPI0007E4DAC3|nr:hypothetical protein [Streptobacillus moniliformis]
MKKIKLNKKIFLQGTQLLEIVLNKKFTKEQIRVYYHLLNDLNDDEFTLGVEEYLKNNSYSKLPLPGEIRQIVKKKKELKEEEIFHEVYFQIKSMTKNTNIAYICDNPITHLIINKLGGLKRLGYMDSDKLEILLNSKLRNMISVYSNIKNEEIPLKIGNLNSEYVIKIGNENKINLWTTKYQEKLENKNG